jgi:mannose-6-phosphate isomerase-like protein (cupin superfamily)
MSYYIKHYNPQATFSTAERCDINELSNHRADADCSIAQAIVAPGVSTQLHRVNETTERYVIIQGQGYVSVNQEPEQYVSFLDVVTISPGMSQTIRNCGDNDLIFLCICTPRFEQKHYQNLEQKDE